MRSYSPAIPSLAVETISTPLPEVDEEEHKITTKRLEDCPVCEKRYTADGERVPKTLPCAHTLCDACLQCLPVAEGHVACPTCTKTCPSTDARTNFALRDILNDPQDPNTTTQ